MMDGLDAVPDKVEADSQEPVTPATEPTTGNEVPSEEAAPQETSPEQAEKTPEGGDTPPTSPEDKKEEGKESVEEKEPMIPKSRLDEVTARLKSAEAVSGRLTTIAKRFGRGSNEYLDALEKYYDKEEKDNPATPEDKVARLEARLNQQDEQNAIMVEQNKLRDELTAVRENSKYAAFKGNWPKWQKIILGILQAEPERTADDAAAEVVSLLDSHKSAYVKSKIGEGKRRIEGGGGGGAIRTIKKERITRERDFDKVIDRAVQASRAQAD